MNAADLFADEAVSPRDAASTLSQSNPLNKRADPENETTDETGPDDFRLLHRVFLDVERSNPGCRTLLEWLKIAKARGCKHHSWIDKYLEAREKLGSPVGSIKVKPAAAPEATSAPVVTDQTAAVEPAGDGKKWTPEKLAELAAYRTAHTMPKTASKFGISEQRIRQLLPTKKPKATPFTGLVHHTK
jgi:hypothetical protein